MPRCLLLGLLFVAAALAAAESEPVKHWPRDYRHIHSKQARAATAGKWKDVIPPCEKMLAGYPQDGEALFFLTLAQGNLGQIDEAKKSLARALAAGVDPGRFLAGPRDWVEPFATNAAFADFRKKQGMGLVHGPMLGCLRPTSARLWVRTAEAVELQAVASKSPDLDKPIASKKIKTSSADDFTARLTIDGLEPNTSYHYDVLIDGKPHFGKDRPRLRTPPEDGAKTRFTLAFGGGAAYTPKYAHMWKTIAKHDPDLLLLLGDNVYIDNPNWPEYQRLLYYRRQSQRDFRKLCSQSAVAAIWDDHDFGANDCAGGPAIDTPKWKRPVWEIFKQNWNNPAYGGGKDQPGCWFDFHYGDVHFIMLDGRYYRTRASKNDPKLVPTMLGPVQKQWLLDKLKNSKAAFKIVASPVPFVGGNPDKWNGFKQEREEIFDFIEKHDITGVVLLSADRHRSDLLVTRRPKGYDLHEFMSSRLTNVHTHGTIGEKDGALFSYNKKCSFGFLTIDTTKADPEIVYDIFSIDDEPIHRFTLKRSQLEKR